MNPEYPSSSRLVDKLGRAASLDVFADAIQPTLRKFFDSDGLLATPVKNALHGTWLGHALHPIVTDVPIGAWTVAAICDAAELFGLAELSQAADVAVTIGTVAAFGAALTGWADWSDTKDAPKRVGIVHAAANGIAVTGYLGSLALRRAGRRDVAGVLGLIAYAFVGAGAYLGGELSTGMQLGVKHTVTPIEPPDDFVAVCNAAELPDGAIKRVDAGGVAVLLSRTGDTISAVSNTCTHRGAALDEGTREGDCIRCPWHGALFDLHDGSVRGDPATFPLAAFTARRAGDLIEVRRTY